MTMMRTLCHNHIMYHTIITINKMFLITTQDYTAIVRALSTPLDKTALRFLRLRWLNNNNDNGFNNSSKSKNKITAITTMSEPALCLLRAKYKTNK